MYYVLFCLKCHTRCFPACINVICRLPYYTGRPAWMGNGQPSYCLWYHTCVPTPSSIPQAFEQPVSSLHYNGEPCACSVYLFSLLAFGLWVLCVRVCSRERSREREKREGEPKSFVLSCFGLRFVLLFAMGCRCCTCAFLPMQRGCSGMFTSFFILFFSSSSRFFSLFICVFLSCFFLLYPSSLHVLFSHCTSLGSCCFSTFGLSFVTVPLGLQKSL